MIISARTEVICCLFWDSANHTNCICRIFALPYARGCWEKFPPCCDTLEICNCTGEMMNSIEHRHTFHGKPHQNISYNWCEEMQDELIFRAMCKATPLCGNSTALTESVAKSVHNVMHIHAELPSATMTMTPTSELLKLLKLLSYSIHFGYLSLQYFMQTSVFFTLILFNWMTLVIPAWRRNEIASIYTS